MMLKSFQKAGQTVKAILHQGPHITPTMPNKGYGILIDGKFYDDIVNEWLSPLSIRCRESGRKHARRPGTDKP